MPRKGGRSFGPLLFPTLCPRSEPELRGVDHPDHFIKMPLQGSSRPLRPSPTQPAGEQPQFATESVILLVSGAPETRKADARAPALYQSGLPVLSEKGPSARWATINQIASRLPAAIRQARVRSLPSSPHARGEYRPHPAWRRRPSRKRLHIPQGSSTTFQSLRFRAVESRETPGSPVSLR
jgi:hypothetical protein